MSTNNSKLDINLINICLSEFDKQPNNLESLVRLAKHMRENAKSRLCYSLCRVILYTCLKKENIICSLENVYHEMTICCYYLNKFKEGQLYSDKLIHSKSTSSDIRNAARRNLIWYLDKLDSDDEFQVPIDAPMLHMFS